MDSDEQNKWAAAIARRVSDEWVGATEFPDDAEMLRLYLEKSLRENPDSVEQFIGTGIIESDYFEDVT